MPTPIAARARYHWTTGTGLLADVRHRWAMAPGRRFPHRVCVGAARPISLAYQGYPDGMTYVLPYLRQRLGEVAGGPRQVSGAPVTWREMRAAAYDGDTDLLVLGCSRGRAAALPASASVVLPFRIRLLLEVTGDVKAMHQRVTRDERRKFARARRAHGWTCTPGTGLADLEFFYRRMYLPTMDSRHGEEVRGVDWDVARHALFGNGVLLFVEQDGQRVAGVLCRLDEDGVDGGATLRLRLLGALDGAEEHYRSGAVKAAYFLTMEWAAENGVTLLDFAGGDPFPGNGVFQFKRRFHPLVATPEDHFRDRRVYLRATRDTPAVRDFLAGTPMFTLDAADRLVATYFTDRDRPPRTDIRAEAPGVHGVRTVDLDRFLSGLPGAAHRTPALVPSSQP